MKTYYEKKTLLKENNVLNTLKVSQVHGLEDLTLLRCCTSQTESTQSLSET